MGSLGWPEMLVIAEVLCLILVPIALLVVAVVDCALREFKDQTTKIVWILIIMLVGVVGPIVYLIVGRPMGVKSGQTAVGSPEGPPS